MVFRLPANLAIGQQYTAVSPSDVTALEQSLPAHSRMLVGLVFSERYDGFEGDCERANEALLAKEGLSTWQDYPRFVTPDPDGEPVAWISYQSSPVWWTWILIILGGIFLLPIISAIPMLIVDLIFPGFTELLTIGILMFVMFFLVRPMTKSLVPAGKKE